jgi:hypothetical protein
MSTNQTEVKTRTKIHKNTSLKNISKKTSQKDQDSYRKRGYLI